MNRSSLRPAAAGVVLVFAALGADSGYIDSAECAACHRAIASSYARTGMARSFGVMRANTPFAEARYRHDASEQNFTAYRRGGEAFLSRTLDVDGFRIE